MFDMAFLSTEGEKNQRSGKKALLLLYLITIILSFKVVAGLSLPYILKCTATGIISLSLHLTYLGLFFSPFSCEVLFLEMYLSLCYSIKVVFLTSLCN